MPPKDFDQFTDQVFRMMNDMFKDPKPVGYQPDRSFSPPMDIYETEDHLVVVMEIAGMKAEDIQVTFDKDILFIGGFRKEPSSSSKTHLHQMEIDYGKFQRTIRIPFPLKSDDFKASYRQGILVITVPKVKEPVSLNVEVKVR
ncbi:MAG: Hsp20/alpha crystallin family protein [Syntrophaceae bacterium]|jgi:HSP20 family protein|nr:Hsp20/alpha crystallin family protein [Syntrophaceae bacterium]